MKLDILIRGACLGCLVISPAIAKVSPEEAQQLGGPKLTEFGAEKAGNADGSIPAYTGPFVAPTELRNITPGATLPDPFPNDKMLYKVDASNLSQYGSIVTAGVAGLLRKYPTFHLNVYQSRRTAGYPQWILDNMKKNATTAELTGDVKGDGFKNAYGGVPFPIPNNGNEVLWNNNVAWNGIANYQSNGGGYFIDASGNPTLTNRTDAVVDYPYYNPEKTSLSGPYYYRTVGTTTAPPGEDGQKVMLEYPTNYSAKDQITYVYTIGQRRVRLAPEYKYDTPVGANGGAFTFDEIGIFGGRPDRFDLKLVGKREVLIPYNSFKANLPEVTVSKYLTPHHPNPDLIRWEKHRVWVVEATLKPGERHIYSRRTLYFDEDTWFLVGSDSYDQAGNLYRVIFELLWPVYNAPYPMTYNGEILYFNLNRGVYATSQWFGGPNNGGVAYKTVNYNPSMFTPESMAGSGIR